ncbi:MAG: hypothetical protein KF810_02970 [Rhizobiaceae bacterium]|nr:hypothetical protein [Rhizobiaceae bacterium]
MPSDDPQVGLRNMPYTIYDRATGDILMWGTAGSPKSINAKLQAGQGLILDQAIDGNTHRIDPETGQPIAKELQ